MTSHHFQPVPNSQMDPTRSAMAGSINKTLVASTVQDYVTEENCEAHETLSRQIENALKTMSRKSENALLDKVYAKQCRGNVYVCRLCSRKAQHGVYKGQYNLEDANTTIIRRKRDRKKHLHECLTIGKEPEDEATLKRLSQFNTFLAEMNRAEPKHKPKRKSRVKRIRFPQFDTVEGRVEVYKEVATVRREIREMIAAKKRKDEEDQKQKMIQERIEHDAKILEAVGSGYEGMPTVAVKAPF